ncbi:hypothetical protein FNF28_04810 [Cafeteria roenbergensis]|uniref:Uncharacterized protein n=1 Tax=Cafeteria roenbergensis TaxID=33653 RepID=A0A5A8DCC6_CAFRO|nr:hypothetical protein FNF28_04810 [Cafeteria roenbergensis]
MAAAAMSEGEAGKALWNAAKAGNVEEATRLLEAGAPVSWADQRFRWSPFAIAALSERLPLMRLLLEHGADLEAKDQSGQTALIMSAANGKADVTALLLEHGADLEAKDQSGQTALIMSAANGKADVMALLLEHGADLEAKDQDGRGVASVCWGARCRELLGGAERLQRWHRRRSLVVWCA